ncbi:putative Membrane Spanning Protein [Bacillus thuringiensis MC28]|nr:putative Membrane Spanning Protein [Bacillus thuringiensis MC28]
MFIQTKFYTIFSFLFGLGFYIFMTRAEAKTDRPKTLFVRRLLILLLFGFLHYVLLWDGDILHTYAIAGFFLFLFYKREPRTILIWAIALLSIFQFLILIASISVVLMSKAELGFSLPVMPLEDWVSQIQNRFHAFYADGIVLNITMLPETVGLFSLGLYAGKKDIFRRTKELDTKLKKWQIITFILTLPMWFFMVRYFLSKPFYEPIYMQAFTMFSGKTLFIFYIFTLMRLLQKEKWQTLLRPFQYVGRMALTNYISHTIVTLLVFGLLFKNDYLAPLWVGPLFCISFYTLQIFISRWWLSHYQYGPLEYIWRLGTYGKMMPLKKKSKVS